jgi:hypothetical protein
MEQIGERTMKDGDFWLTFFIGYFVSAFFIFGVLMMFHDRTLLYKQGQIDALSGKIVYELKQQPDGSVTWVRKED